MSVIFLSLLLIFELIQHAALVNFMLFLNILKILKSFEENHFKHFEEKIAYPLTCGLVFPENRVKFLELHRVNSFDW